MSEQRLHAVVVDELMVQNPSFYAEYIALIGRLSDLLRDLAKNNSDIAEYSQLSEGYDYASNEAFLQLVLANAANAYQPQIYLHPSHQFMIGSEKGGFLAKTAEEAIQFLQTQIDKLSWI